MYGIGVSWSGANVIGISLVRDRSGRVTGKSPTNTGISPAPLSMKKLSIALILALAALGGVGAVWADNAGQTVQAPQCWCGRGQVLPARLTPDGTSTPDE